jgi:glycosyltransferase involved in cell wall biosynthesis
MIKLSIVIMTLNEEKNLARCLSSVKKIADEIVVVDSFSTDKTEEIAKSFNARFVQHSFEDFVKQHQYADSQAQYDWIFTIDADEELSKELESSILRVKQNPTFDTYTMNRLNRYCQQWIRQGSWYPDRKLRLYNRIKGNWQGKKVHEQFVPTEKDKSGFLQGNILHYPYADFSAHILTNNKYSRLKAEGAYEAGKTRPSILKILFAPLFRFLRDYFFRLGFLDGYCGFRIAVIESFTTFMTYAKLREKF